ncbi:hypothetical protein DAPPUDRAFT_245526 [Daphnia pulex]|uniref:Uncharacterized protein n=1 Tax=Daphnia pulex TaxID=6669 RepID=E9GNI8_DAPPU|nr:hypothetical protein DAPPUDRAFT_245526 [Daphnia pulex]|eukprot:EFX78773.1 hypothetical protein DAPPUDRAFT_245526 [Daphnia pulex]
MSRRQYVHIPLSCKFTAGGNVTQPLPCKFTAGGHTELNGGSGISAAGIHSTLSGGTGVGGGVGQSSSLTTHRPGRRLLSRDEMCLPEVQVYLDREGTSDLVAELVMKSSLSPNVFMEAVQLGITLLEGGNPVIQRSL